MRTVLILVGWIRIRIPNADPNPDPGGQKMTLKYRKREECFEVLDVIFGGLKASPVA
jgi:hypothetical protein